MEIAELKHQARALEQQGNLAGALETYRQILTEIDAIGGIRQELPILIKIGDLYLKTGDVDGAVDSYERAASEYATQGAAQPVMSLCTKIVRADPLAVGAYLRLARRLLDGGFTDGAREVLADYAQRANLEKTREGLERLVGHSEDRVKLVLVKAIESAEGRVPKRVPRPKAPPAPVPPPEPVSEEPKEPAPISLDTASGPPPEAPPKKRLTVPVGALDAEPDPSLLEMRPPEPRPLEVAPELAFPTAEELQAAVPEGPPPVASPAPPAAPPPVPPPVAPPPLEIESSVAPPMEGMLLSTMPPAAAPPPPPAPLEPPPAPPSPSTPRLSVPMMEAMVEPPPPTPRSEEPWVEERGRVSRTSRPSHAIPEEAPRPSHPLPRPSRASTRMAAPVHRSRGIPTGFWRLLGVIVVVGVVGVLIWRGVIPLDRLRNLLRKEEEKAAAPVSQPAAPPAVERPDTIMARDTATVVVPPRAAPRPRPAPPPVEEAPRRLVPPTLPPGVALTRSVMLVSGLQVEGVSQIEAEGKTGISIVQLLSNGQRVILEEFPTDTVGAAGEIGVTGIPPDTVVGHVRVADLEIRIKAVGIPEDRIVQFLQDLVEVKP